jgi:DNA-binding transcriptional MerR regulator
MVIRLGAMPRLDAQAAEPTFSERELEELERRFPQGVTSAEVLRIFQNRGHRLSEGTFRKYVQQNLLPRSKRVGKKGKHKGSTGMYPPSIIRQIVAIKRMMSEGLTIEQIQRSYLRFRPRIEGIDTDASELLDEMEQEIEGPRFDVTRRGRLSEEIRTARTDAADLIERLERLEREVAWSPEPEGDGERDLDQALEDASGDRFF